MHNVHYPSILVSLVSGFALFVNREDFNVEDIHLLKGNIQKRFDSQQTEGQKYYSNLGYDNVLEDSPMITRLRGDLNFANQRIKMLEEKLKSLDIRIPKKFPSVKFQDYNSKRRILVRIYQPIFVPSFYLVKL